MTDLLLTFPPQWSPFQPALSLPALSAWLKRAGYQVSSLDVNVLFYEWLMSDECAELLLRELTSSERIESRSVREAYEETFRNVAVFRKDIRRLQDLQNYPDAMPDQYAGENYLAIKSFETYLGAISNVVGTFSISPYAFRLASGNLNIAELSRHLENPSPVIREFLAEVVQNHILAATPEAIGISCIGQEQLYFTLLLGCLIKRQCTQPVIVGGTIFSRIFERGILRPSWFGEYFDIIVRNEGEKPAEQLLNNIKTGRDPTADVPGIVYCNQGVIASSESCPPLSIAELPVPDFDDLPLDRYISPEVTLPLLSARGCYWGKCEFCHHGMVYGEKYAPYKSGTVLDTVSALADRYGVRHFAFNDEALPPATARAIGKLFPPHEETGWTFTGLIKFEKFFRRTDFQGLHRIGFRSLYVGLESASERVLDLMKKRSSRETIVANLTDATQAGVWMHCFLFFGFPGETEDDAQETFDFILNNSNIVSSFGAGTFSLEHNAPIFHHYSDFGVGLVESRKDDVDVYYDYRIDHGITAERALEWQKALSVATVEVPNYVAAKWVPRELLLCMLSVMTPAELREVGLAMRDCGGFPGSTNLAEVVSTRQSRVNPGSQVVINRVNGRVLLLSGRAVELFELCRDNDMDMFELQRRVPILFDRLAFTHELQLAE